MRIGIYLGRHAGYGGGIGVYARGLLHCLLGLLEEPAQRTDELVLYGDKTIFSTEFLEHLEVSPVLSVVCGGKSAGKPRGGLRPAGQMLRSLPNGAKVRILIRYLPSLWNRKLNVLLDQLTVPVLARYDRVQALHSVANIGPVLSRRAQVVTVHDLYQAWTPDREKQARPRLTESFYRSIFRRQFHSARRIITDARHVAAEITSRYSFPAAKISTIPLGLDPEFIDIARRVPANVMEASIKSWQTENGVPAGGILVMVCSDPRKNTPRILSVLRNLPERHREVPVILKAGDREAQRALKKPQGLSNPVTVLPWSSREELIAAYLSARILLMPTLAEGFGFPALEGLSCGCRVISSPLEYFARESPENFYSCDPFSERSILTALLSALEARESKTLSVRIAGLQHARLSSESRFQRTMLDTSRETYRVYRDVVLEAGGR